MATLVYRMEGVQLMLTLYILLALLGIALYFVVSTAILLAWLSRLD